jgi:hypothetical protein
MAGREGFNALAGQLRSPRHLKSSLSSSKAVAGGQELRADAEGVAELRERTRLVLAAAGAEPDDVGLTSVVAEVTGIRRAANMTQAKLLETGKRLIKIQEQVGEGGYRALLRAGLIPLSETAASKLRKIAETVQAGVLPADRLPLGAEAAYIAAKLPPEQIERLIREEVLKPETSAQTLREVAKPPALTKPGAGPLDAAERRRLERLRDRLLARVAEIEARLAQG